MYIIARYNEDVSWADSIQSKFIVQKEAHLPNKGREASSYLWYIVNNYNQLKENYIFVQARMAEHKVSVFDHRCNLIGAPHHHGLSIREVADRLEITIPEQELEFTAGAQFRVSTEQIKQRPLKWYQDAFIITVNEEYHQVAHIFERLWKYIFDLKG